MNNETDRLPQTPEANPNTNPQQPAADQVPQPQQPVRLPNPADIYPEPTAGILPSDQPATKHVPDPFTIHPAKPKSKKKFVILTAVLIAVVGIVFAILLSTKAIVFSEFETVRYTNASGSKYSLEFYAKHTSKELGSGNTQLVSKVSKNDKFPLTFSINSTGDAGSYDKIKNCNGFKKAFTVQNDSLDQTISVCGMQGNGEDSENIIYIGSFLLGNQAHIITVGQDYDTAMLSSRGAAQNSLTRFGIDAYQTDVKQILASIKIVQ